MVVPGDDGARKPPPSGSAGDSESSAKPPPKRRLCSSGGKGECGAASTHPVDTGPALYPGRTDAGQISLRRLKDIKKKDAARFRNDLDFIRCDDEKIRKLFANSDLFVVPPLAHKHTAKQIQDFQRFGNKQRKEAFEAEAKAVASSNAPRPIASRAERLSLRKDQMARGEREDRAKKKALAAGEKGAPSAKRRKTDGGKEPALLKVDDARDSGAPPLSPQLARQQLPSRDDSGVPTAPSQSTQRMADDTDDGAAPPTAPQPMQMRQPCGASRTPDKAETGGAGGAKEPLASTPTENPPPLPGILPDRRDASEIALRDLLRLKEVNPRSFQRDLDFSRLDSESLYALFPPPKSEPTCGRKFPPAALRHKATDLRDYFQMDTMEQEELRRKHGGAKEPCPPAKAPVRPNEDGVDSGGAVAPPAALHQEKPTTGGDDDSASTERKSPAVGALLSLASTRQSSAAEAIEGGSSNRQTVGAGSGNLLHASNSRDPAAKDGGLESSSSPAGNSERRPNDSAAEEGLMAAPSARASNSLELPTVEERQTVAPSAGEQPPPAAPPDSAPAPSAAARRRSFSDDSSESAPLLCQGLTYDLLERITKKDPEVLDGFCHLVAEGLREKANFLSNRRPWLFDEKIDGVLFNVNSHALMWTVEEWTHSEHSESIRFFHVRSSECAAAEEAELAVTRYGLCTHCNNTRKRFVGRCRGAVRLRKQEYTANTSTRDVLLEASPTLMRKKINFLRGERVKSLRTLYD